MANSQKTRRFTSGVNRRLTESLLSSGGLVATFGLITACLTLAFVLWLFLELQQQTRVSAPLARSAAVMSSAINQSVSSLRGWVAYGLPGYKTERSRIWRENIEPTLERLEELALRSNDSTLLQKVEELRELLQELKVVQWAIEDVAKTPGNRPAAVAYQTRLLPLRISTLSSMQQIIDFFSSSAAQDQQDALNLVSQLARFRLAFTRADSALASYVERNDRVFGHTVLQHMDRAREQIGLIDIQRRKMAVDPDIQSVLSFALKEFEAYDRQVNGIISLQQSSDWNVAQHLYLRDAQPIIIRTAEIAGQLSEDQAQAMSSKSLTLSRASYFVTGMALLMGLISAGSLLLSRRLRRQVETVMEQARMLGHYEIDRLIARGGMGEVYLGHHAMLRRPTAVKLLRADNAQDLEALARFQREVRLTSQLTHPNTVEIYDYGRTPEGVFYYAMEYLDGFNLTTLVEVAGPVAPARVVHILKQVCRSLREAHGRGFLHRDLKPSNIMLTEIGGVPDTLKILDFGLVKNLAMDTQGEKGAIIGTPRYLAPECIIDPESASPQSDIYALGSLAYFMLSGQPAFSGTELTEILARQLAQDLPFPSQVLGQALPQALEQVVMSCLSKEPSQRPHDVQEVLRLLDACQLPNWSEEEARQWWRVWGESARSREQSASSDRVPNPSGIYIDVNRTHSPTETS